MHLKKLTGAKISLCKEALEKSNFFHENAVDYINKRKENYGKQKEKKYKFCQIEHIKNNKFVFFSFKAETDFVINYIKNTNLKDILFTNKMDNIDNSESSFVRIKEKLEDVFSSLTKEEVVLCDIKLLEDIIFYNNLNGDSCSLIQYKNNNLEEKKNIQYSLLHSDYKVFLSPEENILKSVCVSVNCLEKEDISKLNSYLLGDITLEEAKNVLDTFSEKPIVDKLLLLKNKGIDILKIDRMFVI